MPYCPWSCNPYLLSLALNLFLTTSLWAKPSNQIEITAVSYPITLQSVANSELFQSPEGNTIKLIHWGKTCQFEGVFYYETGKIIEQYWFKGKVLIKAQQQDFHYTLGGLSNLQDNQGKFDSIQRSNIALKIDLPQIQQQFQIYRSLFPNAILQQC